MKEHIQSSAAPQCVWDPLISMWNNKKGRQISMSKNREQFIQFHMLLPALWNGFAQSGPVKKHNDVSLVFNNMNIGNKK